MNKKILCFVPFYLPGSRSGGPVRSIKNFSEHFDSKFQIMIFCNNHDLGEKKLYKNITSDAWNDLEGVRVFYASKKTLTFFGILKFLRSTDYDLIYLNSFFSQYFSIYPLVLEKFFRNKKPIILNPRGEFSSFALSIKPIKKQTFIKFSILSRLYKGIDIQVTTISEKEDFVKKIGYVAERVFVAPDLLPKSFKHDFSYSKRIKGPLRIVYISRIVPIKNLDFLLTILTNFKNRIDLKIYGPVEDEGYFQKCKLMIKKLPECINVKFFGHIENKYVHKIFQESDVFFFPSRGESFGYVILESIFAGTPVITSNFTPWINDKNNAITTLDLDENKWIKELEKWVTYSNEDIESIRISTFKFAKNLMKNNKKSVQLNNDFFCKSLKNPYRR